MYSSLPIAYCKVSEMSIDNLSFLFLLGDVEFDWEEQHEKFAEVFDANGDRTNDSGFNTAEKSYRSQEVSILRRRDKVRI